MNRQQKEAAVADFKNLFSGSKAAFLVGYKGLTVSQMQNLRRDLRSVDSQLKVTKARLMKIAAKDVEGVDEFSEFFKDQVGLVFANKEVPPTAKKLVEFAKNDASLTILSGFFDSKVISKNEINFLANLPTKDILLAQVVGTIQAPISGLARLLNMMLIRLLYCLKEIEGNK